MARARPNRLDRLLLRGRDPDAPCTTLLVVRLQWLTVAVVLFAVVVFGWAARADQRAARVSRQQVAQAVTNDCVDRTGDIAFRNVLAELVRLNEHPAASAARQRQRVTAVLREGIRQAGQPPTCIISKVP